MTFPTTERDGYHFRLDELAPLFPAQVVEHLLGARRTPDGRRLSGAAHHRAALVVAARISAAFPGLPAPSRSIEAGGRHVPAPPPPRRRRLEQLPLPLLRRVAAPAPDLRLLAASRRAGGRRTSPIRCRRRRRRMGAGPRRHRARLGRQRADGAPRLPGAGRRHRVERAPAASTWSRGEGPASTCKRGQAGGGGVPRRTTAPGASTWRATSQERYRLLLELLQLNIQPTERHDHLARSSLFDVLSSPSRGPPPRRRARHGGDGDRRAGRLVGRWTPFGGVDFVGDGVGDRTSHPADHVPVTASTSAPDRPVRRPR